MLAQGTRGGLGFAAIGVVVVGVALAVAAREVHAPTFVIATTRLLAFFAVVAVGRRGGLRRGLRIGWSSEAEHGRLARIVAFQQGIVLQRLIYLGVQLQSRQLQ